MKFFQDNDLRKMSLDALEKAYNASQLTIMNTSGHASLTTEYKVLVNYSNSILQIINKKKLAANGGRLPPLVNPPRL